MSVVGIDELRTDQGVRRDEGLPEQWEGKHGSDALSTVIAILARPEVRIPPLLMTYLLPNPKVGGVVWEPGAVDRVLPRVSSIGVTNVELKAQTNIFRTCFE